jgi:signal peptide peptidase SppA
VWALDATTFHALDLVVTRWAAGVRLSAEEIQAAVGSAPQAAAERRAQAQAAGSSAGVAVLPVYGVLTPRAYNATQTSTSLTSTELLASQLRSMVRDPGVAAVVLDFDTPGGNAQGVQEAADVVASLRGEKPIVGVVNHTAGSGGYWLAAACDEVVVTPSGWVGSIGAFIAHDDMSAAMEKAGVKREYVFSGTNKVEGNPTGPLTPDTRAYLQNLTDQSYVAFTKSVAKGRNVSVDTVRSEAWGQGRMVRASDAVAAGMADRIDTLENTIARLGRPQGRRAAMSASTAQAQVDLLRMCSPIDA